MKFNIMNILSVLQTNDITHDNRVHGNKVLITIIMLTKYSTFMLNYEG